MALKITFEARTDVGRERNENQDHYGSTRMENVEFFIVCDGMGGHAGGSTASRLGVQAAESTLEAEDTPVPERMEAAVHNANDAIHAMSQERRELRGMGTTAVILGVDHETQLAHVVHVGDSRIYRLRDHYFQRLTRDHTMVQRLVDEGIITEDEAEHHPNSNVISRSLGGHPTVEVEHGPEAYPLEDGDIFLLCTDGLSGLITEQEMAEVLAHYAPEQAAERLIDMANEAGGHDNITVEIILIGEQKPPFMVDVEIIHPPKGPTVRELRERELAAMEQVHEEAPYDPPPIELPAEEKSKPEPTPYVAGAPVLDDQNNGKLLTVLFVLVLLLILLVAGLLLRTSPAEEIVVPAEEGQVAEPELPFLVDDEEPEPQPVYDVTEDELEPVGEGTEVELEP